MTTSVLNPSEVQATYVATLVDEWVRSGLRDVVICPGSRSTPLALAVAARPELRAHVRIDERSAGFFALGRARASRRPVAVVVTSGTAAAELHPCVAEADLANVPLLVVTADRPPELHGVGAPQTMDQYELFGAKVRVYEEPGVATWSEAEHWRALANRLWLGAVGATHPSGPVHLNAAFIEPLVASARTLPPGRDSERPWQPVPHHPAEAPSLDVTGQRVLCVVGQGVDAETIRTCSELHWVVVGDATAEGSLAYADPLLRSPQVVTELRPDVIVRLGGIPASKILAQRVREWGVPVIGLTGAGFVADPDRVVTSQVAGLPRLGVAHLQADPAYPQRWRTASRAVGDYLATHETFSEPFIARSLVTLSTRLQVPLVVGSSMPVRDVEWWAPARQVATYANRGVNGIDGVTSTILGVASGGSALGLIGDVTMLHDVSALVDGLGEHGGRAVIVVVDNDGGGIFSFLSQREALDTASFERFFGTPRRHDLRQIVAGFGHAAVTVTSLEELDHAVTKAVAQDGITFVIAHAPNRDDNVATHAALNDGVVTMLGGMTW